ncbi:MAG: substrate-binding domain-containing protein [Bryobacteraceae bacterium]
MFTRRGWLTALPILAGCGRGGRTVIGVIPKAVGDLFFAAVHAGVRRAARESGVEIVWNGPKDETDHGRQIQIVDSMVAQRVAAIAISATDERALRAPVERAIAAGIPVTVFDSGVEAEGYVTFVATDNYGAGCTAARKVAELSGKKGKVGMVMHKPGGTSTMLREEGFQKTMAAEFPDVVIAARLYGMADRAKARGAAENMLTGNPDIGALFASSEASSLGAIQALQSRELNGKVRLITFDTSSAHVEALAGGTIDVMMVQDSARIGYEAVRSLTEKLAGRTPARRMDLPVRLVTKDMLGQAEIKELISPKMDL